MQYSVRSTRGGVLRIDLILAFANGRQIPGSWQLFQPNFPDYPKGAMFNSLGLSTSDRPSVRYATRSMTRSCLTIEVYRNCFDREIEQLRNKSRDMQGPDQVLASCHLAGHHSKQGALGLHRPSNPFLRDPDLDPFKVTTY